MKKNISQREQEILRFIKHNIKSKGYPPSVREIGQAVGLKSSSTVHSYLRKMEEKELIRRDPTKPRAMEILDGEAESFKEMIMVPVLGRVAAGVPLLAVENREDLFPLPANFAGHGEFFMLQVKGDSMVEAGILEGDLVLVRRQPSVENGDIAVALIEDEATIKRFYHEKDHIRLQPENYRLSPIIVKDVEILGKVVGLIRKF
ncbi:transcriptional repressor LexA [Desulfoscipio geothermicus]|uniref:LexA repressor n=1 Tax=Desulfoscipio geothermicus DSM 3669 TaxID=1121426 RepID=A0A1I6DL48_9FIRM|nr:transcriptional repressor LexA [Desulfoscipio geothermicus]SFR06166.1 SOS-response transcriptional repressor, LexA [Desulfoscipio geothermicus DSM 3669]